MNGIMAVPLFVQSGVTERDDPEGNIVRGGYVSKIG